MAVCPPTEADAAVRIHAFLAEYRALCERHQAYVGACGCCDSPFIELVGLFPTGAPNPARRADELARHFAHLAGA